MLKIGAVDPEMIGLQGLRVVLPLKRKLINRSKTCELARSAGRPIG